MVTKINPMGTILHPTKHQGDIDAFKNEALGRPWTGPRTGHQMVGPNIEEFNRMKARINCTDKIHKIKLNK